MREAEAPVPEGLIIKSITRSIELDPYFSSGLRFLVLECMSFRMTMALIRSSDVLTSKKRPFPYFIQFILSFAPWLSCLQSISLFLITSLHSEFDKDYFAFFQPYAYLMVGVFTFLEMLCDLFHDAFDGRFVFIQTSRFYIKSAFFVTFSACFPYVVLDWLEFYKVKRCHAYVPLMNGIFEYICAASIIAYNFINAQTNVEMYITPTSEDVRNVSSFSSDVYIPVCYGEQSVIYESLNSVRK
uniref:MARVEL domain-containing protein n=1 Tax=Caenorhabditis tropicalis TaxID=1561998 RepID=A0A1I7UNF2_9PELO